MHDSEYSILKDFLFSKTWGNYLSPLNKCRQLLTESFIKKNLVLEIFEKHRLKSNTPQFYPCFQADCKQLKQLAPYRNRNSYALSSTLCQILGPCSALYLVQFTHTMLRSADWLKITIPSAQDPCGHGPGVVNLKCLNKPIFSSHSIQSHCDILKKE